MCQRRIHIVSAKQKMIAYRDPLKGVLMDFNQAEVRGPSADIAHQNPISFLKQQFPLPVPFWQSYREQIPWIAPHP
jgi:hypothetical protein